MLLNGEIQGWYDSAQEAHLAHSLMGYPLGAEIYEMPVDEGQDEPESDYNEHPDFERCASCGGREGQHKAACSEDDAIFY